MNGIKGRVHLVTGAAQRIGRGIAMKLAETGARLGLIDLNRERLEEVADDLRRQGCEVLALTADIADERAITEAVATIESQLGPIEALVNVAGVLSLAPLVEMSAENFNNTFAVNVQGTWLTTRAVARCMIPRRSGVICTVTSTSGRVPRLRQGAYGASKSALAQLMRVFALELAPWGIRCNCVAPGSTETEMIQRMAAKMGFREQLIQGDLAAFRVGIPLGRNAQVDDIAHAVLFTLSDEARHITMHELVVDGGGALGA